MSSARRPEDAYPRGADSGSDDDGNNINAIRTRHYPDASAIYELCDEYGIYLIAENNMETHGTWDTFPVTGDYAQAIPGDHMGAAFLLNGSIPCIREIRIIRRS